MGGYLERLKTKKRPPQAPPKLPKGEGTPTEKENKPTQGTAKTVKSPFDTKDSMVGGHISETRPEPKFNDGRFMVTENLAPHPAAAVVPDFEGDGYDRFKAHIEKYGLIKPIILFQGKILDGRARYRACRELGRPVIARQWEGGMDPITYIVARNILRTHKKSVPEPARDYSLPPAGSTPEYKELWHRAWTLADWIDNPEAAPIEERRDKLPELDRMRAELIKLEQPGAKVPENYLAPVKPGKEDGDWITWEPVNGRKQISQTDCPARCKDTGECYGQARFDGKSGSSRPCVPEQCAWDDRFANTSKKEQKK